MVRRQESKGKEGEELMAWAVCTKCGESYHYFSKRGMKLRNQPCPKCGGMGEAYRRAKHG